MTLGAGGASNNLADLSELSVDILAAALRKRFAHNAIYTYVGDILVAVNPFAPLPLYDAATQDRYLPGDASFAHVPHIYRLAQHAFTNLVNTRFNQCCVISGESGAGKVWAVPRGFGLGQDGPYGGTYPSTRRRRAQTESAKHFLDQLLYISTVHCKVCGVFRCAAI